MNPKPLGMLKLTVAANLESPSITTSNFRNRCSFALAFGMMIGASVKDSVTTSLIVNPRFIFLIVDLELQ